MCSAKDFVDIPKSLFENAIIRELWHNFLGKKFFKEFRISPGRSTRPDALMTPRGFRWSDSMYVVCKGNFSGRIWHFLPMFS